MSIQDNQIRRSQSSEILKPSQGVTPTSDKSEVDKTTQLDKPKQTPVKDKIKLFEQMSAQSGVRSGSDVGESTEQLLSRAIDQSDSTSLLDKSGHLPHPGTLETLISEQRSQIDDGSKSIQLNKRSESSQNLVVSQVDQGLDQVRIESPNQQALKQISNPKLPVEQRLEAIGGLDTQDDAQLGLDTLRSFIKDHGSSIRQSHASLLAQTHEAENQAQKLLGFLPKDGLIQDQLGVIRNTEATLRQKLSALQVAIAKGEDVTELVKDIQVFETALNDKLDKLQTLLPVKNRDMVAEDVNKYISAKKEAIGLKIQSVKFDILSQAPAKLPVSAVGFLCKGHASLSETRIKSEIQLLAHDLNKTQLSTKSDVDRVVSRIAGIQSWKLDNNENFEVFYRQILGTQALKELPHELRGHLLARLHQEGIGNPDLIVHYIMNNARNMTGVPDRRLLQRPEIQQTDIYQKARASVLKQTYNKLKATCESHELLHKLQTDTAFDTRVLGSQDKPNLTAFSKLKEALTDKHVGPQPLISTKEREDFVQQLKLAGIEPDLLTGEDGQRKFSLLVGVLTSGDSQGLPPEHSDVAELATRIKDQNVAYSLPPLAKLYFEIQGSDQKDAIVQSLKTGSAIKLSALLDDKGLPDQKAVNALSEALRLGRKEGIKDAPELVALYDQLHSHPQKDSVIQSLRGIPVLDSELHAHMLEMPEATALKAYETVVDAGLEHPDFGRFTQFHSDLKDEASVHGYTEGRENVPVFQKLQGKLDPGFFKKLDQVKNLSDPQLQKEACERLLAEYRFVRTQDEIEDFFMDYVMRDVSRDRRQRDEIDKAYQELMDLKRPLNPSDLRNIGQLVGGNIEYYSQAIAERNPKAPVNLAKMLQEVRQRGGEMQAKAGVTSTFTPNPSLQSLYARLQGPALTKGEVNQFFDAIPLPQGVQPHNREWVINLELIRHALAKVPPDDVETRNQLSLRALAYLSRFATIPNPGSLGVQSTPVQRETVDYHRINGNSLVSGFRMQIAETLGTPVNNVQLVTDNRVMEVIKRDLRHSDHHQVCDIFNPQLSSEDQGKQIKALIGQALSSEGNQSFFVDISPVLGNLVKSEKDQAHLKDYLATGRQFVSDVITQAVEDYADEYIAKYMDIKGKVSDKEYNQVRSELIGEMKQKLGNQVVVGGTLKVGEQSVLYTAPIDTDFDIQKPSERTLPNSALLEYKNLIYHSGFTAGPNQLLENWLQLSGLDGIMNKLGLPQHNLGFPQDSSRLETFRSHSDFLAHDTVTAFNGLKDETAPYLKILPKATVKMLAGLNDTDLQRTFAAKGLSDHLQMSYNRILGSMEKAVANKDNFNKVLDQIQLIHEEIAGLLTIANPHQAREFNAMMQQVTKLMPDDFDKSIQPEFVLKNSGMRGLATVFTGIEQLKGSKQLNIAVQNDTYYESSFVITGDKEHHTLGNREHTLFSLDGDKLDETVGKIETDIKEQKLDLYLCEFHHNISYSKSSYHMENLTEQVDELFDKKLVSDKFTVAIDNTIAETDGEEFKKFLKHNEQRIKDGQLNIVLYRSAQKFDMMGMDNFNGGIMSVINNRKDFAGFNEQLHESEGRLDNVSKANLQGFTHFEKYIQAELNEYRLGVMSAARRMANPDSGSPLAFPKEMYIQPGDDDAHPTALLKIAPNTDDKTVFLDLKCPIFATDSKEANQFLNALQNVMMQMAQKEPDKYPLSNRASFGFPHSNISLIGGSKFRYNPGLESDETLGNFKEFFVSTNKMLLETYQKETGPQRNKAVLEMLNTGNRYRAKVIELGDKIQAQEKKGETVAPETRLEYAKASMMCFGYGRAQEQLDKLKQGNPSEGLLRQVTALEQELAVSKKDTEISVLRDQKQPVPNALLLERIDLMLKAGDKRAQTELEQLKPENLDEGEKLLHQQLQSRLPVQRQH